MVLKRLTAYSKVIACLAAMDGAETVSAYARFNCTARYDAASDEYIVVVLYG